MNSSDWLAVTLTLVGTLSGGGIAWAFFRAQQQLSFNAFDQKISDISSGIAVLRENTRMVDHIDVARELGAVRSAVDHLDSTVGSLVARIVGEVNVQQQDLLAVVQAQFEKQVYQSRDVLRRSVASELSKVTSTQDLAAVENRLTDLVTDTLTTMGHYQIAAIEAESLTALKRVEEQVVGAIGRVGADVHEIRERLDALDQPVLLPAGNSYDFYSGQMQVDSEPAQSD